MYKDKEVNKNVNNIFLSMCDIYFTEFGTTLTTILPICISIVINSGQKQKCQKYFSINV